MTRYRDYTTPTANIQLSMYYSFYRHISAGKNLNIQFFMSKKSKMALNTRPIVSGIMESIQAMIISNIIGHNATCASVSISSTESSSKNPANTHPMNAYIMIPIIIFISSHLLSSVKVQFSLFIIFKFFHSGKGKP